jgi:hypothetical protein
MTRIKLPIRFFADLEERILEMPEVLARSKQYVVVSSLDPLLEALLGDAIYYAHRDAPEDCPVGVKLSAKATVRALQRAGVEV